MKLMDNHSHRRCTGTICIIVTALQHRVIGVKRSAFQQFGVQVGNVIGSVNQMILGKKKDEVEAV